MTQKLLPILLLSAALVAASACSRNERSLPPATTGDRAPAGGSPATAPPGTDATRAGPDRGGLVPYGVPINAAVTPTAKATTASLHTPDGKERTYRVYVPPDLPKDQQVPLLVAMHGGLGWGEQFENQSGFDGLAESNNFIVVYPDGNKLPVTPNGRVWNGGGCCALAAQDRENIDDVTFLSMLIDQLVAAHPIDRARVFASGHSNGAIMSFRLACELADKVSAIAVQAGTVFIDDCQPSRPIPVLTIHGTADQNLPLAGGVGEKGVSGADFRPPRDGLNAIAAANGCAKTPTDAADPANNDVTYEIWSGCRDDAVVELVKVAGASHAWMGHQTPLRAPTELVGETYMGLDSSAVIWSFLAGHPRRT